MATKNDVTKTLTAMQALMPGGDKISKEAAKLMLQDLEDFPPDAILIALKRCRDELEWFPTVAHIKTRIMALDGRPGVEEAWSMAPKDDYSAAYLNDEIMQAWGIANDVLKAGDSLISARMAFKEVYDRVVREARMRGRKPTWWLSRAAGANRESENQRALQDAVDKGRLLEADAKLMLPDCERGGRKVNLQLHHDGDQLPPEDAFQTLGDITKRLTELKQGEQPK